MSDYTNDYAADLYKQIQARKDRERSCISKSQVEHEHGAEKVNCHREEHEKIYEDLRQIQRLYAAGLNPEPQITERAFKLTPSQGGREGK